MPFSDKSHARLIRLWDQSDLGYNSAEGAKEEAHALALRCLRHFATTVLNLDKKKFNVRSNPAGIAVSGEVTLITEPLEFIIKGSTPPKGIYVQIGQCCLGNDHSILFRAVDHRADYTGYRNNFTSVTKAFANPQSMMEFGALCRTTALNPGSRI